MEVFQLLGDGDSPYRINHDGVLSLRSAQRLKAIKEGAESGRLVEDLAAATEWSERRVTLMLGWAREYQSTRSATSPAEAEQSEDTALAEARQRHFQMLMEVASKLGDDLEHLAQGRRHPVWFDASVHDRPRLRFRSEFDQLFASLRSHIQTPRLWEAYDNLKSGLVANIERVFSERDGWSFVDNGEASCVIINVPMEYWRVFGRRGSVIFDLPDSFDVADEELRSALLRGIVGGRCEYCPET